MHNSQPIQHIFIDLSFFCVQRGHIFKDLSYNGKPTGIYYGILSLVKGLRESYPDTAIHICRDGNPVAIRRKYPAYKINRDEVSYKPSKDFAMLKNLQKMLVCYPKVYVWYDIEQEADAVIASLALQKPLTSVVCSGDNDFLQLMSEGIRVAKSIRSKKFDFRTEEYIIEKYGVTSNNLLIFRALQGDKSDNISGVVSTKEARLLISGKKDFNELTDEQMKAFELNVDIMSLLKYTREPLKLKPLQITPDKDLFNVFGLEKLLP